MKHRVYGVVLVVLFLSACNSVEHARKFFESQTDHHVGREIESIPLQPPERIEKSISGSLEYHYRFTNSETGEDCTWVYIVDPYLMKVTKWEYTSKPDSCYRNYKLGSPW